MTLTGSAGGPATAIGERVNGLGRLALVYVAERRQRGEIGPASARTAHYTLRTLTTMIGWDSHPHLLTKRRIEKWMGRRPLANSSRRAQLSIVRGFCQWLVERGELRRDPTAQIRSPRQPRYMPRAVSKQAVEQLLRAAPDQRAQLILLLMAQEGLRCCEVVNLQLGDVDWQERTILVHGKGDHERVLPASEETWATLVDYSTGLSAGPLIRSYSHPERGVCAKYVSRMTSQWCQEAGVRGTAHSLRHHMAGEVLRCGAHLRDVQAALGHRSLATTQRYLPLLVGDLRQAMGGRRYRLAT